MSLIVKENGGGSYDPVPQGIHQAVCYAIYDLGTQYNPKFNKEQKKLLIIFELPHVRIDIEENGQVVNKPRVISNRYTASLNGQANLRKDLETWRGKPFTKEELDGFSLSNILGKNCQIQIMHNPDNQDPTKVYANITNIMPLAGQDELQSELGLIEYDIGQPIPEGTPEWMTKLIMQSKEMGGPQQSQQQTGYQQQAGTQQQAGYQQPQQQANQGGYQQQGGGYQQNGYQQQGQNEEQYHPEYAPGSGGMGDPIPNDEGY